MKTLVNLVFWVFFLVVCIPLTDRYNFKDILFWNRKSKLEKKLSFHDHSDSEKWSVINNEMNEIYSIHIYSKNNSSYV